MRIEPAVKGWGSDAAFLATGIVYGCPCMAEGLTRDKAKEEFNVLALETIARKFGKGSEEYERHKKSIEDRV